MTRVEVDVGGCPSLGAGAPPDLTWLVHRAAQHLRCALDDVARRHGLGSARDWLVLTALVDTPGRTQLSLASAVGLDKTTLTSMLDRLEADGLVVREQDPRDRRARIPVVTRAGRTVQRKVAKDRDRAEAELPLDAQDHERLRELLGRLVPAAPGGPGGSCI